MEKQHSLQIGRIVLLVGFSILSLLGHVQVQDVLYFVRHPYGIDHGRYTITLLFSWTEVSCWILTILLLGFSSVAHAVSVRRPSWDSIASWASLWTGVLLFAVLTTEASLSQFLRFAVLDTIWCSLFVIYAVAYVVIQKSGH